jgi:hypothetical protein
MAPEVSRYLSFGNTLLVTASFAETITFSALLTVQDSPDIVKTLLGLASALFLGSITGFSLLSCLCSALTTMLSRQVYFMGLLPSDLPSS